MNPPAEIPKPGPIHSFSVPMAMCYGLVPAVVAAYALHRLYEDRYENEEGPVAMSKVFTRAMITRACPYLNQRKVRSALQTLVKGKGEYDPLLYRRKVEKSVYRYSLVPGFDEFELNVKESGLHRFESDFADRYGIVSAVMRWNFLHWAQENWKHCLDAFTDRHGYVGTGLIKGLTLEQLTNELLDVSSHTESAAEWQQRHPYVSLSTVHRTMARLIKAGELILVSHGVRKTARWSLPPEVLNGYCKQFLTRNVKLNADQRLWRVR